MNQLSLLPLLHRLYPISHKILPTLPCQTPLASNPLLPWQLFWARTSSSHAWISSTDTEHTLWFVTSSKTYSSNLMWELSLHLCITANLIIFLLLKRFFNQVHEAGARPEVVSYRFCKLPPIYCST